MRFTAAPWPPDTRPTSLKAEPDPCFQRSILPADRRSNGLHVRITRPECPSNLGVHTNIERFVVIDPVWNSETFSGPFHSGPIPDKPTQVRWRESRPPPVRCSYDSLQGTLDFDNGLVGQPVAGSIRSGR